MSRPTVPLPRVRAIVRLRALEVEGFDPVALRGDGTDVRGMPHADRDCD